MKKLRPDTGDGQSLPCLCGVTTPDSSYCCGFPLCNNCMINHICEDEIKHNEPSED